MKASKELLHSFDPAVRARAGREMVDHDLGRAAKPLLHAMADELDDRVVLAVAHAVVAAPQERRESRKVAQLRAWAAKELERLELEDRFFALGQGGRNGTDAPAHPQPTPNGPPAAPAAPRYISWHPPA